MHIKTKISIFLLVFSVLFTPHAAYSVKSKLLGKLVGLSSENKESLNLLKERKLDELTFNEQLYLALRMLENEDGNGQYLPPELQKNIAQYLPSLVPPKANIKNIEQILPNSNCITFSQQSSYLVTKEEANRFRIFQNIDHEFVQIQEIPILSSCRTIVCKFSKDERYLFIFYSSKILKIKADKLIEIRERKGDGTFRLLDFLTKEKLAEILGKTLRGHFVCNAFYEGVDEQGMPCFTVRCKNSHQEECCLVVYKTDEKCWEKTSSKERNLYMDDKAYYGKGRYCIEPSGLKIITSPDKKFELASYIPLPYISLPPAPITLLLKKKPDGLISANFTIGPIYFSEATL